MKIGIRTTASCRTGGDAGEALRNFVVLAHEAERLGYWSMWSTEHHFGSDPEYRPFDLPASRYQATDYDMVPDPLVLLSHLAATTSTLRLGTAVVVPHWDHPLRMVERVAMLDVMSGGRLELGVGRGQGYREAQIFDVPMDNEANQRKFAEEVDLILTAWQGDAFTWNGEFFQLPKLRLTPRPQTQQAPVWVASSSLSSAIWAAERGLAYTTSAWPVADVARLLEKCDAYDRHATQAGYEASTVDNQLSLFFHCAATDEEAAEVGREAMLQMQYITEQHYELQRGHAENATFVAGKELLADVDTLADVAVDHHIIGSPKTCAERLDFYGRELDMKYLVGIVGMGNMEHEQTLRSLRLFAEEVLPRFVQAAAA